MQFHNPANSTAAEGGLDANILHTVSEGKVFGGELLAAAREYNIIQLLIINICIVTA